MAINYGEMKVKVTPRGVMSGRIGVSGPPSDDYENLIKKPQINGVTLIGDKSNADLGIPTELADLTDDETHRTVTDEDIETWNAKSDFSGSYNDLTDVPDDLVEDGDYVHTDNNYTNSEKSKLEGIESGAEANVQSDWEEIDNSKDSFIKNKPDIPTDLKDLSDDSTHRLVTDSNISTWNAKSDFSGSYNDLTDKPAIPDELKDLQDDTTHRLVTDTEKTTWNNKSDFSGSYNDLTNKPIIPTAQVNSDWNADSGVAEILNKPNLEDYIEKSETAGLIKNDGTVDTSSYALTSQIPDVSILGNTDISGVADGTVTGAIDAFANTILGSFDYNAAQGKLYYEAALGSPYTFSLQNGVLIANRS